MHIMVIEGEKKKRRKEKKREGATQPLKYFISRVLKVATANVTFKITVTYCSSKIFCPFANISRRGDVIMTEQNLFGIKKKCGCGYFSILPICICLALIVLAAVLLGLELISLGIFIFLILLGLLVFIFF